MDNDSPDPAAEVEGKEDARQSIASARCLPCVPYCCHMHALFNPQEPFR